MTFIKIGDKYYPMPTCWNELTGDQLVRCLPVIYADWSDGKKQLALLRILTGIGRWRFLFAHPAELSEYFYRLSFLFEQNTLTRNLVPRYDGLHGPGDNFCNITVSEFIFSETFYLRYRENNEIADLDMLIAVLYRAGRFILTYNYRINPAGDFRRKFNDNLIDHYVKKIRRWPIGVKNAILHYYEGCRGRLVESYSDVFGGSGEPARRGMLSLMVSMAETGTFGPFDQVEKLYLHTFMIGLSEAIDKAEKMKTQTSHG